MFIHPCRVLLFRTLLFMVNKEIDHLYSLSLSSENAQNVGQFSVNSIRMKSSLGLAGKAYTSGKIAIESDASEANGRLISEEKDLAKLKVTH